MSRPHPLNNAASWANPASLRWPAMQTNSELSLKSRSRVCAPTEEMGGFLWRKMWNSSRRTEVMAPCSGLPSELRIQNVHGKNSHLTVFVYCFLSRILGLEGRNSDTELWLFFRAGGHNAGLQGGEHWSRLDPGRLNGCTGGPGHSDPGGHGLDRRGHLWRY